MPLGMSPLTRFLGRAGRLRGIRRRHRPAISRWQGYLRDVEPVLAAVPRVHRFAEVPRVGTPATLAVPLAAWIDGATGGLEITRTALRAQTVSPVEVCCGTFAEALGRVLTEGAGELGRVSAERPGELGRVSARWIALLHAGDVPAPLALERLGQAAELAPEAIVLTADEDVLAPDGARREPRFAPGPSPDHVLAVAPPLGLLAVRADAVAALPPGRPEADPGWRYELLLRLAGPDAGGYAHVPNILVHRGADLPAPDAEAELAVAREALALWRDPRRVEMAGAGRRRLRRPVTGAPPVEVLVCFRDGPELLERCTASVLDRSGYAPLTLGLVDNGSVQDETHELVRRLSEDRRVRHLRDDRPFNFAALNNAGARTSSADVLVFLNNDTEVLTPGWIEELLEEATRPEVGAVAPLLTYPDGRVQHAGAALGLHGYAGHPFAGLAPEAPTPFGTAADGTRNWLAVTAACLMVERRKFEAVGGFDETFVVAGNDVDLCLRLTARGHRSLCLPHVRLLHDESRSRGAHIDPGDFARSEASYGAYRTVGDPFYNPNLTLARTDCDVRGPGEGPA